MASYFFSLLPVSFHLSHVSYSYQNLLSKWHIRHILHILLRPPVAPVMPLSFVQIFKRHTSKRTSPTGIWFSKHMEPLYQKKKKELPEVPDLGHRAQLCLWSSSEIIFSAAPSHRWFMYLTSRRRVRDSFRLPHLQVDAKFPDTLHKTFYHLPFSLLYKKPSQTKLTAGFPLNFDFSLFLCCGAIFQSLC